MAGIAEYDTLDGLAMAALVKAGQLTAAELAEEALARAGRVDGQVNSLVRTLPELARARAAEQLSGPFQGAPFLVKDLLQSIPGVPTEMGSIFWQGWTLDVATNLYQKWLAAGVVPVGKTTTPELGILPVTETTAQGATRNPWDLTRTAGGSSGGSGAAVAAGIVPLAAGGDGGGSIRIPSSCCGLFGLKPSRGRTPVGPLVSEGWAGFAQEHVLSRSVRDSAAMLDATQGYDPASPYASPPVYGSYLDACQQEPKPLRIAVHWRPPMPCDAVHADCIAAVQETAKLCEELGHRVEQVEPKHPSDELGRAFLIVIGSCIDAEIRNGERVRGRNAKANDYEQSTWISALLGKAFSAGQYVSALWRLQAEMRRVVRNFADFDLVLTPTLAYPPVKIGELDPKGVEALLQRLAVAANLKRFVRNEKLMDEAAREVFRFTPFTPLANFCGFPSMSVPLSWNRQGLPIGSMFTGRFGREDVLFSLAGQLERARPWADRRAPVHAGKSPLGQKTV